MCAALITFELVAFTHHLIVNASYLHRWANFNVMLMSYTFYTAYITVCSLFLLIKADIWLHASYKKRLLVFIASLLSTNLFFAHLLGVSVKLYRGLVEHSFSLFTVFNILSIYTLILEVGAVLPAIHIFFFEGLAISPYSIFNKNWGSWREPKDSEDYD